MCARSSFILSSVELNKLDAMLGENSNIYMFLPENKLDIFDDDIFNHFNLPDHASYVKEKLLNFFNTMTVNDVDPVMFIKNNNLNDGTYTFAVETSPHDKSVIISQSNIEFETAKHIIKNLKNKLNMTYRGPKF